MSKRLAKIAVAALVLVSPVMAADTAATATTTIELLDTSGFVGKLGRYENVYVASQPTEAGLKRMAEAGVVAVINLRRPEEMGRLEFDQHKLIAELGMDYVQIPQGGDYPRSPEVLDQVAKAIADADGKPVLLHCASATRVSHIFAAWLHRERGIALEDATAIARRIGSRPVDTTGYLVP